MNDELPHPTSSSNRTPTAWDSISVLSSAAEPALEPAATFTGRTGRTSDAVRAGIVVGAALVVAIGAAVAMGASPAPSASTGGAHPSTLPGTGNRHGSQPRPFGFPGGGPAAGGRGWAPGGPGRGGIGFGKISVTAISGSNVSLATADGWTRTIALTGSTTITKGGAAAKLGDLAVGDMVRFAETHNADGSYTITRLDVVQPETAGTVTAVGAGTITIMLHDGTSQTIKTTGSTTYHRGQASGTHADVTVGSNVAAIGSKAADGSFTASSVWVAVPRVAGKVTAVGAGTITIMQRDGSTLTIHVGSSTTIQVGGVTGAKLTDVKAGMGIVVEGAKRADGSIDAAAIGAGDLGKGRGHDFKPGDVPDGQPAPGASLAPQASGGPTG